MHLSKREYAAALDAQFLRGYRTAALLLGLFFAFLAAWRFLKIEPHIPRLLMWEAAALAVFYGAFFGLTPQSRLTHRRIEDLGVLLVLGAVLNAVLQMVAAPTSLQTTNFMLVQVGSGLVFRSHLRYVLIQALNLLGWVALFLRVPERSAPAEWAFAMLSAVLVALAIHLFLTRTCTRMELLFGQHIILAHQRERLIRGLRQSLAQVKTLRGLVPICAHCKKIRDDQGFWHKVEQFVRDHSEAEFTHGICPDCAKTMREELDLGQS